MTLFSLSLAFMWCSGVMTGWAVARMLEARQRNRAAWRRITGGD